MFSRSLLAAIAGITILPLAALLWVGWRLLGQESILAAQEAQQRVERAADSVTVALQRAFAASEQQLASDRSQWPEGAVAVAFRAGRVDAHPNDRLVYVPVAAALPEAPDSIFAEGDRAEFQLNDRASALASFRELAGSSNRAVRAGALLRMARNLRAAGQTDDALAEYAELTTFDDVSVGDVPASLAAAYARCKLLDSKQRRAELVLAARSLQRDLGRARWSLTPAVFQLYTNDAARWSGDAGKALTQSELFAQIALQLWDRWASLGESGSELFPVDERQFVVLWLKSAGIFRALIATPEFAESQWVAAAVTEAKKQEVELFLGSSAPAGRINAARTSRESSLPWDIMVAPIGPPAPLTGFTTRRRLLILGFGLLVVMASAACYFVFRAVRREKAVARLQADFVAAVSHEFRTPLTTLAQFTDRLREHPRLDEESRRVCYDAQGRATVRLTRLVESLLDFGCLESGERRYDFEQSDCSELVQRVVEEFRGEAAAAGHHIEFHRNGPVPVDADREALSRAVWNLIENAVKYSPQQPGVAQEVEVGLDRTEGQVRIAVRDRGIGIAVHERNAIFKRFQRGEQAQRRGIPGTGIGLAMVAEIAKAHHGRVEVESRPGEGSTFTIVLPVKGGAWRES